MSEPATAMNPASAGTKTQPGPPGTGTLGLGLFLASLTMLFGASLVGYLIVRFKGATAPPMGSLHVPGGFWWSTAVIIVSSITFSAALGALRAGKIPSFQRFITVTLILGLVFLAIQIPNLIALYDVHTKAVENQNVYLHALVLLLIGLHGAHVVGGVIPLGLIVRNAFAGRYSADAYRPVRHGAIYWHFLDVVWVIMFGVLYFSA